MKADVRAAAAAYRLAPVASSEQLHASGRPHAAIVGAGIGAFLADNVYWGVKSDGAPSGGSLAIPKSPIVAAYIGLLVVCLPGDAFLIFEGKEEAERATEGKLEGLASLQLHLTTKGEVYGHLAQYERNVSEVLMCVPRSVECLFRSVGLVNARVFWLWGKGVR